MTPTPVPPVETRIVKGPAEVNVATTTREAPIPKEQVPDPEQSPLQPEKLELVAGVAVSVTCVALE